MDKINESIIKAVFTTFCEADEMLSDVEAKWTPPEGLFTEKAEKIANVLYKHSKDLKQAMARLTFYMNRAGENLTNKTELEKAKKLLHKKFDNE